ncbi:MAG: helix-hairpin-helix domain-containing protein [Solirubrobacteraceae bacterium]
MPPAAPTAPPFDAEVRVAHTLYETADKSFAVVLVQASDGETVTAAGPLSHLAPGTRARVVGRWQEHPKYGHQVKADFGYELDPDDAVGVRKYLLTIRHIGKSRGRALIERYGEAVLEQIDADPEAAFYSLPGLGRQAAARAAESWRERRVLHDLYLLLAPHGTGWLAGPLRARHGGEATALVRTRPYLLTEEHGVGFATADAIARTNGAAIDSQARLRAATVHLLREAEVRGHTFLSREDLRARAAGLVGALEDSVHGGALAKPALHGGHPRAQSLRARRPARGRRASAAPRRRVPPQLAPRRAARRRGGRTMSFGTSPARAS